MLHFSRFTNANYHFIMDEKNIYKGMAKQTKKNYFLLIYKRLKSEIFLAL